MATAFEDQIISSLNPTAMDLVKLMLRSEDKVFSKFLPLSTGGFKFRKLKSPALEDAASKELRSLKRIARDRESANKLVDKNLGLSVRLLRENQKAIEKLRRGGLPPSEFFKAQNIEKTLGKFEKSTLELFSRLRRLKSKAKFQKKFLDMKKDVAETSLRDLTLQGRLGSEAINEAIRTETSKRLKAIFKKIDK